MKTKTEVNTLKSAAKAGHTPGPWNWVKLPNRTKILVESKDLRIAQVEFRTGGVEPMSYLDDARLIAAAPDLLEAAKWGLKIALNSQMDDNDQAVREIRAAIARAEGKHE